MEGTHSCHLVHPPCSCGWVSCEMSLLSTLKSLNNIPVTVSLQEVSLAPTDHVSSQAIKIFVPDIQNASWVCSFSSWEHYYLPALKSGRQLEKLQHGNNIGKPGKLYEKQFFSTMIARTGGCSKEIFFVLFCFVVCFSSLWGKFSQAILIHILMDKCVKTAGSKCCRACVLRDSWFIYVLISFLFLFMVSILQQACHTSSETELNSSLLVVPPSEISVKCISLFFF